jgi:hypothetical protein
MCPHCEHPKSGVTETRKDESGTWRRRKCYACKRSFVSHERTSADMEFPRELKDALNASLQARRGRAPAKPIVADKYGATSGFTGWSAQA